MKVVERKESKGCHRNGGTKAIVIRDNRILSLE